MSSILPFTTRYKKARFLVSELAELRSKGRVRKLYLHCLLFIIHCLLCILPAAAQKYTYKHFSSIDGLPSSEVYEVIQDKKGFIWFCTDHGICRYDGYQFKTFPTGLADNTIFQMVEDSLGMMWCVTFSKALYLFDGKTFSPYLYNDSIMAILARQPVNVQGKNVIRAFFPTKDKYLTLSFSNGEIAKISTTSFQRIVTFAKPSWNNKMPNSNPYLLQQQNCIVTDVIHTRLTSGFLAGTSTHFLPPHIANKHLPSYSNLQEVANGFMFLIFEDSLFIVDAKGDINSRLQLKSNFVHAKVINGNTLAIGYQAGCQLYRFKDNKWKLANELLAKHYISNFCGDNQGNMWITTVDDGVYMFPNLAISTLPLYTKEEIDYKVTAMRIMDNHVFLATEKQELYQIPFDRKKSPYLYKKQAGNSMVSDMLLRKEHLLTNGDLAEKHQMPGAKYMLVQGDTTWVGGIFGLARMINGKKDTTFDATQIKTRVTSLCQTKKGLLVGTLSGLYQLHNEKLFPFLTDGIHKNARISAITEDKNGYIWVATRGMGIMVVQANGHCDYLSQKEGLPTDFIEHITIEKQGLAWVSTFSGLVKLAYVYGNPLQTRMELFTNNDGLPVNEIGKTLVLGKELWIATSKGLGIVPIDSLYSKHTTIPLIIEAININGQNQAIQSHYELSPNQQHFGVSLTGLFLRDGKQLKYIYELTGEVTNIDTSENQLLQFYNLHSGMYKLTIYAYHPQTNIKSSPQVITFRINPYFTQTIGFYLLLLGIILGTMLSIFVIIYRNQRLQNLTRMEMMQWEQKALRAQMNPHFIFNVLNSIQAYIWDNDRESAMRFLGNFSHLIRKILQHSSHPTITLENELSALKLFLELEKFRIGKALSYSLVIDPAISLEHTLIPPTIFQPLVENAIWHGIMHSPRAGEITISIQKEGNMLIGSVEDNGVGLSIDNKKNVLHESIGLKNIQARLNFFARQNKGEATIRLENKEMGEGTIFIFKIPLVLLPKIGLL